MQLSEQATRPLVDLVVLARWYAACCLAKRALANRCQGFCCAQGSRTQASCASGVANSSPSGKRRLWSDTASHGNSRVTCHTGACVFSAAQQCGTEEEFARHGRLASPLGSARRRAGQIHVQSKQEGLGKASGQHKKYGWPRKVEQAVARLC